MKKLKKIGALVITYLFLVSIMPFSAFAAVKGAVVPQYLKCNDKYILNAVQYKDKLIYGTQIKNKSGYWDCYAHVKQGNSDKNLGKYSLLTNDRNNAYLFDINPGNFYKYSFNNGKVSKSNSCYEAGDSMISNKYDGVQRNVEYLMKPMRPDDYDDKETYDFIMKNPNGYYLRTGRSDLKMIKVYWDDRDCYDTQWVFINNSIYAILYNYDDNTVEISKYNLSGNKYVQDTAFGRHDVKGIIDSALDSTLTIDFNDNLWFLQKVGNKEYVVKVDKTTVTKKYEVSNIMDNITVYDDDHLTVWNTDKKKYVTIDRTTAASKPAAQPTYVNMHVKTKLYNTKASMTYILNNLVQNKENKITVPQCNVYKSNTIALNNFNAIKSGKGSVTVKCSYTPAVNIPFKSFDASLLKTAKSVYVVESYKKVTTTVNKKKVQKNAISVDILYTNTKGKTTNKHYTTKIFG